MPELAEVEYYRKQWDAGLNKTIRRISLASDKRIFRGEDTSRLAAHLIGTRLLESQAQAKQMLFRFSKGAWLGIHLGMTGKLTASTDLKSELAKHDHLVLESAGVRLIFNDPRQFGRVRYHEGRSAPDWWRSIPPAVGSETFTLERMTAFLQNHPKLPIKGTLLLQDGFPGVGNWMADEILWRARIHPQCPTAKVRKIQELWTEARFVCTEALRKIGVDFSDPPEGWFFHERWSGKGVCPIHGTGLQRATVAGRTTAWCAKCQAKSWR